MNELSLLDTLFGNDGTMPSFYTRACTPNVDVKETKDAYILTMDLPGRNENDVEIGLKDDILTIASVEKAETKEEKKEDKEEFSWLIHERHSSSFKRTYSLPKDINPEAVTAVFKNGVLTVRIERKAAASAKKIAIRVD